MKRLIALTFLVLLYSALGSAQDATNVVPTALDRLASLTSLPLPDWKWHDDVPHPEDISLDDAKWELVKLGTKWSTGTRVFRHWLVIPEKIDGYAIQGARIKLDLALDSNGPDQIAVFSNGSLVFRGNEDTLQSIPLGENLARPEISDRRAHGGG
jgi:hypothetical protein